MVIHPINFTPGNFLPIQVLGKIPVKKGAGAF
jgi:hypothetical protein